MTAIAFETVDLELTYEQVEALTELYQEAVVVAARRDPVAFLADYEVREALDGLTADPLVERPATVREVVDLILWADAFREPSEWSLLELVAREGLDIF